MMRWLFVLLVLCAGVVAAVYFTSPFRRPSTAAAQDADGGNGKIDKPVGPTPAFDRKLPEVYIIPDANAAAQGPSLEVTEAHVVLPVKTEVPSERDGKIIFLATEFKPGERVPKGVALQKDLLEGKVYQQEIRFLAIEVGPGEVIPPGEEVVVLGSDGKADGKRYRRWKEGDRLDPGKLKVCKEMRLFRKLEVGNRVQKGDMLALVNPALALDDLLVKAAKLEAADADAGASIKTRDEAERRFYRDRSLRARSVTAISEDELRASELAWQRYAEEVKAKTAAILSAQQELNQTITVLKMHEIRSITGGMVTQFYKYTGDAVKNLDQVLELRNPDQPRIEGMLGLQHALKLRERLEELKKANKGESVLVTVEVTRTAPPRLVLEGHNREVNAVAVGAGDQPIVLSGDEAGRLCGWTVDGTGRNLWRGKDGPAVRSLACAPAGEFQDRGLVGLADGVAYLTALRPPEDKSPLPRWVLGGADEQGRPNRAHQGSVNSVAFSPNGKLCATAGESRDIVVWDTATQKVVRRISEAHRAPVTSVQFASEDELVSAGRDYHLMLWKLDGDKEPQRIDLADYRGNGVPRLGVDRVNRRVLIDLGKELRVFSLKDMQTVTNGTLRNPSAAGGFATMALFSPDGQTILTNSPADGKLQLWRAPWEGKRPYEQRQLRTEGGAALCGAFGQRAKDNFVAIGTQSGKVQIWDLPGPEEQPLEAALTFVDQALEGNVQQVRIWAEPIQVPAPSWVVPGSTATMVIHPNEVVRTADGLP
jgi:WD40 repeat protein